MKRILVAKQYINDLQQSTFNLAQPGKCHASIKMPSKKAYTSLLPLSNEKIDNLRSLYVYIPVKY